MRQELKEEVKVIAVELLEFPLRKAVETTKDGTVVMLTPGRPDYLSLRIDFPDGCKTNFGGSVQRIKEWYGLE